MIIKKKKIVSRPAILDSDHAREVAPPNRTGKGKGKKERGKVRPVSETEEALGAGLMKAMIYVLRIMKCEEESGIGHGCEYWIRAVVIITITANNNIRLDDPQRENGW